jgi:hypothetical protein
LSRIAEIKKLVYQLDMKYEGHEKPIDSDLYFLIRNLAKYLLDSDEAPGGE